jgi:hypothetical protein
MLEELAVPEGEYLLQTAAGSVLGRQIIQVSLFVCVLLRGGKRCC